MNKISNTDKRVINKQKYIRNKKVAEKNFKTNKNSEWEVTVLFYAALHLIEGTFPAGKITKNHIERRALIEDLSRYNLEYKNIRKSYIRLYDYSIQARYCSVTMHDDEVAKAKSCLRDIEENLKWAE